MQIARVVGTLVATRKHRTFEGAKLLMVQPLNLDDTPRGNALLAIDGVGAGVHERVLIVLEGRAAGEALGRRGAPVDAAIIGIVDNYQRMSWNFGPTLLTWMARHAPDVHAALVAAEVTNPTHRTFLIPCKPADEKAADAACAAKFLPAIGRLLYRHPLAPEQTEALVKEANHRDSVGALRVDHRGVAGEGGDPGVLQRPAQVGDPLVEGVGLDVSEAESGDAGDRLDAAG